MINTYLRGSILSAIALVVLTLPVCAQTGTITGLVTDVSGAVVGGAKVTVEATSTGATRDVLTGSAGAYTLVNLIVDVLYAVLDPRITYA